MGKDKHSSYATHAKRDPKSSQDTRSTRRPSRGGKQASEKGSKANGNGTEANGDDKEYETPDPSGSPEFQEFVKQCMRQIEALLLWKYPGVHMDEKEDVFQDVILALWKRTRNQGILFWLDSCHSFERRIAENKCIDRLRHQTKEEAKREIKQEKMGASYSIWGNYTGLEQEEIQVICLRTASKLTDQERSLWETYVEHYPKSSRGNYLAKVMGLQHSPSEMKRRIGEIRKRFLGDLRDGGYDLDRIA